MMRIIVLVIAILSPLLSFAQMDAVTSEGKTVVLYEDGTWEYKIEHMEVEEVEVEVNKLLNSEGEMEELYFIVSPRLERFFSGAKNKIRGKSQCSIQDGQAKISFQWETYLGDGNRYFGYLKEGVKVTLKMKGGSSVMLFLTQGVDTDIREKFSVTVFKGTALISQEQLNTLLQYSVESIEVDWKKNPEEYPINNPVFFRKTFQKLLGK